MKNSEKSYFAVIFSSQLNPEAHDYPQMAEKMVALATQQPGYVGFESVRDASGHGITISYWESEEAILGWKKHTEHQIAQQYGKKEAYDWYDLKICRVLRERTFDKPS